MTPEVLVPPTRSLAAGMAAVTAMVAALAVTGVLLVDARTLPAQAVSLGLGALWAVAFGLSAKGLLAARDGLVFDAGARRLGLVLTDRQDIVWLASEAVVDVRVQPVVAAGDAAVGAWRGVVVHAGGVEVVLLESGSREVVEGLVTAVRERLGALAAAEDGRGLVPGAVTLSVRRGAPLQAVVLAYGLALSATGAAALVRGFSGGEPVSGFMLGPLLALAGVALLAVAVVKRLGREQLTFDGADWQHGFALGRRTFGARTLHGPRPVWRLRLEGARGALLELVGAEGTLVLGAGATSRSDQSVAHLLAVPDAFREASDRPRGET